VGGVRRGTVLGAATAEAGAAAGAAAAASALVAGAMSALLQAALAGTTRVAHAGPARLRAGVGHTGVHHHRLLTVVMVTALLCIEAPQALLLGMMGQGTGPTATAMTGAG
jgi:hypothetical protein